MAEVVLRAGTLDDVPGLRALGAAVVPPTYGPIDAAYGQRMLDEWWTAELFEQSLPRVPYVVAAHAGEVVAVANLLVHEGRETIGKFYVHPDHQRQGIGERLLAAIEEHVEGEAVWLECLVGNEPALAFYDAHGFEEVERVPHPPWPDDILMRKALAR